MSQFKTPLLILFLMTVLIVIPFSLGAVSSTSYTIDPADDTAGTTHSLTSSSFKLEGSVEPVVGLTSSTSYKVESGAATVGGCGDGFLDPNESCDGSNLGGASCTSQGFTSGSLSCSSSCTFNTSACVTTASSGGSGGGGGGGGGSTTTAPVVTAPTVTEPPAVPSIDSVFTVDGYFTYESQILIYGKKDASATSVEINGLSNGVTYPTNTTWNKKISLEYGKNSVSILAKNTAGSSAALKVLLLRKEVGDMNADLIVNDYDLSRLVRIFNSTEHQGDFNLDGKVDDYDLSLLVAHWDAGL